MFVLQNENIPNDQPNDKANGDLIGKFSVHNILQI